MSKNSEVNSALNPYYLTKNVFAFIKVCCYVIIDNKCGNKKIVPGGFYDKNNKLKMSSHDIWHLISLQKFLV